GGRDELVRRHFERRRIRSPLSIQGGCALGCARRRSDRIGAGVVERVKCRPLAAITCNHQREGAMSEMDAHGKRLLLISNSTLYGSGYLDHAEREIRDFLGTVRRVLFIPFAQHDHNAYAASARRRLAAMGYEMDSAHEVSDMERAVNAAEAVFVGGGNTFRLLQGLYDVVLLPTIP